jgi:hypothetical protein
MTEELIQLPNIEEIKEMLDLAKRDIKTEVEQDSELKPASELLTKVIDVVEDKIAKTKDLEKLATIEKIDLAAHLHFLQSLLEDFFMFEDFEDEDFNDEEEEEEEER